MEIPHSRPIFGQTFEDAVQSVVRSGALAQGDCILALEQNIQSTLSGQHVIAVDSGTSALMLSIRTLTQGKINPQVGIPAYACASLLFAVRAAGATPVLMDCDNNLCLNREPALQTAQTLDVLILVHPFGMADPIISESFPCPVIEDIAQSAGVHNHGKPLGTYTDISIGSFYATKPWGAAYGGFASSPAANIIENIRAMTNPDHANLDADYVGHHQLSNLHAAVALARQNTVIQDIKQREHWSDLYDIALQNYPIKPIHTPNSNHFRYIIRCESEASQVIARFHSLGIKAMPPVQKPLHHAQPSSLPCDHADQAWKHCVSIPLLSDMSEEEFAYLQQGFETCLTS